MLYQLVRLDKPAYVTPLDLTVEGEGVKATINSRLPSKIGSGGSVV
jgi:hypothetical protein